MGKGRITRLVPVPVRVYNQATVTTKWHKLYKICPCKMGPTTETSVGLSSAREQPFLRHGATKTDRPANRLANIGRAACGQYASSRGCLKPDVATDA